MNPHIEAAEGAVKEALRTLNEAQFSLDEVKRDHLRKARTTPCPECGALLVFNHVPVRKDETVTERIDCADGCGKRWDCQIRKVGEDIYDPETYNFAFTWRGYFTLDEPLCKLDNSMLEREKEWFESMPVDARVPEQKARYEAILMERLRRLDVEKLDRLEAGQGSIYQLLKEKLTGGA